MATGQTFKDLSKQPSNRISLSRKEQTIRVSDSPCYCARWRVSAFPYRRRLSGMYAWPSCAGTAAGGAVWRSGHREVRGGGYLLSQPVEFLHWAVFGTRVNFSCLSFWSLLCSSLFVQTYRSVHTVLDQHSSRGCVSADLYLSGDTLFPSTKWNCIKMLCQWSSPLIRLARPFITGKENNKLKKMFRN